MLRFVNDFISCDCPYAETLINSISIKYNNNGHRSKDETDLDTSNYILFAGCSHTEGYGLESEEIYTYQLAQHLNMDHYNLGVGGSGCDVMFYNVISWLHKYKHKPKLIVLQWPFQLRYIRLHDDKNIDHIQTEGSWSSGDHINFSMLGERIGYFSLRTKLYYNMINQLDIPTIHVSFPEYNNRMLSDFIKFQELDKARDNMHLGPLSHSQLSLDILKHIKDNNLLI